MLAAAAAARLLLLFRRPLWHDELFTLWIARLTPGAALRALRSDSGPPLFYLLERPLAALAGALSWEPAARLLPWLAGVALLAGAAALPRGPDRRRFAALCAASPLVTAYSAEARPYALLALEGLGLFLLARRDPGSRRSFVLLAALGAAALYTHYLAIFLVAAVALVAAARHRWRVLAALGVSVLVFLPWVPVLLSQPEGATRWTRETVGATAVAFLSALGGVGRIPDPLGGPLPWALTTGGVGIALAWLVALRARPRPDAESLEALAVTGVTLALVLLAGLIRPIAFGGRSEMAVLGVALWGLARAGAANRLARGAAWAGVATGLLGSALLVASPPSPSIGSAVVAYAARLAHPGDLVIAGFGFYLPARLAADRGTLAAEVDAFPPELASHPGWFDPAEGATEKARSALGRELEARRTGRRLLLMNPVEAGFVLPAGVTARGRWRELLRHPQAVIWLWEPAR